MKTTVRLFSTLALMGALRNLSGRFEAETGTHIDAVFAPTVGLLERLHNGEVADVLILTTEALDDLAAKGTVAPDSCVHLARSFIGLAVKAGAAHPDISTEAALRNTLLGARSVAYSRIGASGIFFAQLIERMGIAPEVNARALVVPSGFTAERLVSDEADIAIQQLSELKLVAGVDVVGPLPLHLQTPGMFSGGRVTASDRAALAEALLKYLASPAVAPVLRQSGLEP
ncbi:MAG TPA: substrate-binding domain-containing protein [Bradyrhizobium sp.]|nr:substrate-binding domain-containing protein [Bradyrhizobium sp.]